MRGWLGRLLGRSRATGTELAEASAQARPLETANTPEAAPPRLDQPRLDQPRRVAFLDVETTGLTEADRIVSIGVITLDLHNAAAGTYDLSFCHLIFDPGRKSHSSAERAHGYDDWTLRHQDGFAEHAETVRHLIHTAETVVAHNAAFDLPFVDRELVRAGLEPVTIPSHCTMLAWRRLGYAEGASLAAAARRLGLQRSGATHSALEDAYLAMQVYLVMARMPRTAAFTDLGDAGPVNWREPPPRPEGPLPRRKLQRGRSSP